MIDKEAIRARWRPGNAVLSPAAFGDIGALLAELDEKDRVIERLENAIMDIQEGAHAQRNAVLALHQPRRTSAWSSQYVWCIECERIYPCPSVRALGVES